MCSLRQGGNLENGTEEVRGPTTSITEVKKSPIWIVFNQAGEAGTAVYVFKS